LEELRPLPEIAEPTGFLVTNVTAMTPSEKHTIRAKKAPQALSVRGSRADFEVDQATSKPIFPQAKIAGCDDDHTFSTIKNSG
jgi:hypothetical protein